MSSLFVQGPIPGAQTGPSAQSPSEPPTEDLTDIEEHPWPAPPGEEGTLGPQTPRREPGEARGVAGLKPPPLHGPAEELRGRHTKSSILDRGCPPSGGPRELPLP